MLGDKIDIQYKILINDSTIDVNDITVKFRVLGSDGVTVKKTLSYTNEANNFVYDPSNGRYAIVFGGLIPNELSNKVLATVYVGDTAVSNTLCYSVESYVAGKYNDPDVGAIAKAIMKYGDAAKAYNP